MLITRTSLVPDHDSDMVDAQEIMTESLKKWRKVKEGMIRNKDLEKRVFRDGTKVEPVKY